MKALILSAGLGTRLRPLTDVFPKALVPVANQPVIDIIITQLKQSGISSFGINLHYMPEKIKEHLENKYKNQCHFYFSNEKVILGTGGGIAGFKSFLCEDEFFVVHNCDILSSVDIGKAIKKHKSGNFDATLVLVDNSLTNCVSVNNEDEVVDIWGRLGKASEISSDRIKTLTFSGIAIYNSKIVSEMPEQIEYSIIDYLLSKMKKGEMAVNSYIAEENSYWRDLGNKVSYIELHRDILCRKIFKPLGLDFKSDGKVYAENSEIGSDIEVEGFVVVGERSKICDRVKLRDVIVFPDTVVNEDACISESIIIKDLVVEAQK